MKKKIFIITQGEVVNTTGGAITSFINISDFLSENYDVYCICYTKEKGQPNLKGNVKFINLYDYYNNKNSFSEAINHFSKENRPDIFMFFFAYLYEGAKLSSDFDNIPRILLFRSRPDLYFKIHKQLIFLKKAYKNTVAQILFPGYYNLLPDYIKKGKVVCIPNPVFSPEQSPKENTEHKRIIYLSRIDCWKGQEFLIKSFSLIADKYKDWTVDIFGQSQPPELEIYLKHLVKSLKLENQIHFCGVTKEPFKTYLNYDFCVFPSFFEGFPLGLAESMSSGLPAIGFKGASGVNELIKNNENGFLTKDNYKEFADKIEILINNRELRRNFSQNASALIKIYNREKIKIKWNNLVSDILTNKQELTCEIKSSNNYNNEIFSLNKISIMQIMNYWTKLFVLYKKIISLFKKN